MTDSQLCILILAIAPLLLLPFIGLLIEALRKRPTERPSGFSWTETPASYVNVHGADLRYVRAGSGPTLFLLHTLRTQLDMFQKVFDRLAEHADVIAVDYPGHGFSDIPDAAYTPELFRKYVAGFLDALDLTEVTVVGESIGASIGLQLAGEKNPRISRVIAINPYDYGRGRGVMRSSLAAKVFMGIANVPVIGITTWRLRFFPAHVSVMKGGISNRGAIPDSLMKEMYHVGSRPGHLKAFISLIRHFPDWESDRSVYANIEIPVTLVYGERDWSTAAERLANESEIPNAKRIDIAGAGHFLSIDAPDQAVTTITETTAS